MLVRQKVLLNLISEFGGRISRMRLVKLAFLFAHDSAGGPPAAAYQFLPYRFGPFSFTLYHDLDKLVDGGCLQILSRRDLCLSKDFAREETALVNDTAYRIKRIVNDYGGLSLSVLVDLIYSHYPWFTLQSDLPNRQEIRPLTAECAIYTAGYEGLQVDGFVGLLLRNGIKSLIDVRANPISRSYGFHGRTLARICRRFRIQYRHLPQLGVPSSWRVELNDPADYDRLFQRYVTQVLKHREDALTDLGVIMASVPSALVCYESDPRFCHRSRLANALSKITSLEVLDLNGG